jgi:hypothetical protein
LTITSYYPLLPLVKGVIYTMPSDKPIMSFRIRTDIKEALQKLANADRRTLSSYVELALERHIIEAGKKKEAKRK